MAARLVECASCGVVVDAGDATADTDLPPDAMEQAPELVRFYCPECWAEGPGS